GPCGPLLFWMTQYALWHGRLCWCGRSCGRGIRCLFQNATSQRTIQIDGIGQAQQTCLYQLLFCREQFALRIEYVQRAGNAVFETLSGKLQALRLRILYLLLRIDLLVQQTACDQSIGHFPEGSLDTLFIVRDRDVLAYFAQFEIGDVGTGMEDRQY